MIVNIASIILLVGGCFWIWYGSRRSPKNVLEALKASESDHSSKSLEQFIPGDPELVRAGITTPTAQREFEKRLSLLPFIIPLVLILIRSFTGGNGLEGSLICIVLGFSVGVLSKRRIISHLQKRHSEQIKYFLPLAMERIVMAVEAGLDLVPAMKSLVTLDESLGELKDPTINIFKHVVDLSEHGIRFDEALEHVASSTDATPLKHAFVHLSVAYRDGGEIVGPLRELSEATQLQYQEEVEENIARLPVKATMPLMLMFLGMLLCFLTPPAIQVISVAGEMSSGMNHSGEVSHGVKER